MSFRLFSTLSIIFCWLSWIPLSSADTVILAKPKSEHDPRQEYAKKLLELVLNYPDQQTSESTPPQTSHRIHAYKVIYSTHSHSRERIKQRMLEGKDIDVQATATRPDWEQDLLPIRIPIFKGLLGYRILLIHKVQQQEFANITHLEELKDKQAILGTQWSITPIWKTLGFNTLTNLEYESLFKVIQFQRADYFPRGVNEILQEHIRFQPTYQDLTIEQTKGLYLPLPMYFFVSPKRPELARRIEENLENMIKTGDFSNFFHDHYDKTIETLNINNRKIFYLDNPNLPAKTPLNRKELWYVPQQSL